MISFTTQIDLKLQLVHIRFLEEVRTFAFNDKNFTLANALMAAGEYMACVISAREEIFGRSHENDR